MTYEPTVWNDYAAPCINAANLNKMEHGIDIAQGDIMVLPGLTANRPATDAELVGRLYFATDAPYEISRDNGGGWDVVGYTSDLFTALGTLQVGSGAGAAAPLGIGGAGEVLTVAGGTATWAASAAGAWTLIGETILGAPAANVTFAAIPGTYRVLVLYQQARTDRVHTFDTSIWRANGDAGNNYDWVRDGINTGPVDTRATTEGYYGYTEAANSAANHFSPTIATWYAYADTNIYKKCISDSAHVENLDDDADLDRSWFFSDWRSAVAITTLTLLPATGPNFVANSRFTLYGIT